MATARRVFRSVMVASSLLGVVGVALAVLLPFEEPTHGLLLFSTALALAPVAAVLVHVKLTTALTVEQRRVWLRKLTGRRAAWAFAEYLSCDDLGSAADKLGS